ncbi:hypothetical protein QCA50_004811 [Cerrena zonata]|uniref:Uncharacterized protein n=1 Tax=Cerrena zonata TaxID=2478898 RepID=A0AAW0GHX5_9APHY
MHFRIFRLALDIRKADLQHLYECSDANGALGSMMYERIQDPTAGVRVASSSREKATLPTLSMSSTTTKLHPL